MKTMTFKLRIVILLLVASGVTPLSLQAQTWQWGKSGGTTDSWNTLFEVVNSVCTDIYGNVYVVSDMGSTASQVAGIPQTNYNDGFGATDGIIASFSCNGAYRWSKVIGGAKIDFVNRIQSDNQGNVYVLGQVVPITTNTETPVHFDTDYTITSYAPGDQDIHKESIFLIKYDSMGNFQWLRMPQPANISMTNSITNSNATDLQVDAQGNSYSLCYLTPGLYASGAYSVGAAGFSVLKYDTNGNFLGGVPLDIELGNPRELVRMKRNHNTGDIYIGGKVFHTIGADTFTVNGELITKSMFIAAFNSSGSFLWKHENANSNVWTSNYAPSIAIDTQNNVYFCSAAGNDDSFLPDSFNGTTIGTATTASPVPFIAKMDANGNPIWLTNGNRTSPLDMVINGNEVAISGGGRNIQWQNLSYVDPVSGRHPYLARFNKETGEIIAINALVSSGGTFDIGSVLTTDSKGNYYMGGSFTGTLTVGPSALTKNGGTDDFFIAKFGSNDCDFLATTDLQKQDIAVYPNPFTAILHIQNTMSCHYIVYDVLGHQVASGTIAPQASIDMTRLASGLYMLALQEDTGNTQIVKVVKE